MLELYAFATPNSIKPVILLEELGASYAYHAVNVRQGEQKAPEFLAMNPNGKVPVLKDSEGLDGQPIVVTESAAILIYLAKKSGRFIPQDETAKIRMFEWLFFHASGLGPAFGQAGYFQKLAPETIPAAIDRFLGEAKRTLKVLDTRLAQAEYLAGADYSIADIANFGWLWRREFVGVDFAETPNVARWYAAIEARPAITRAVARVAV
jgi:glutathione S-transferase